MNYLLSNPWALFALAGPTIGLILFAANWITTNNTLIKKHTQK